VTYRRDPVDADSRRWVEQLRAEHPQHERAVARLHDVPLRVAYHELSRRRGQLRWISGPEFDDLAHQAADDALVNILARLDEFRGLSRFTTRDVFVAIALNDVPMDVLALQLGSSRNAIYKNLFDARRNLRVSMAAVGHPVAGQDAIG